MTGRCVTLVYHYFHPCEVVSARLFFDLARSLAREGWRVSVVTSDRDRNHCDRRFASRARVDDVDVYRVSRGDLESKGDLARGWSALGLYHRLFRQLCRLPRQDAILFGSDPPLLHTMIPAVRRRFPHARIGSWIFDVYPEIVAADRRSLRKPMQLLGRASRAAHRASDFVIDLGPCMRRRLMTDTSRGTQLQTISPWALSEVPAYEPANAARFAPRRELLFGRKARVGILYSGRLGRAHDPGALCRLAEQVHRRDPSIALCFSGNEEDRRALSRFPGAYRCAPSVGVAELAEHLQAADLHLISLRDGFEGLVVPSKYQGALAVGRPTIFVGPRASSVATWTEASGAGLHATASEIDRLAEEIVSATKSQGLMSSWSGRAHDFYREHFSQARAVARFAEVLRS